MKIREILELMNRTNNQPPMLPDQALAEIVKVIKGMKKDYVMKSIDEPHFESNWSQGYDRALDDVIKRIKE